MNKKHAALVTSIAGVLAIAGYEGFSETSVQPLPGDRWTIGFGHTERVSEGDVISFDDAVKLLVEDLKPFEAAVNKCARVELDQHEFDALVSLAYNIGAGAFCRSTLVAKLNDGDYPAVWREWMRWKYFNGVPVRGLEVRRARELAVFRGEVVYEKPDGNVCFGSAGCFSLERLLAERKRGRDGAAEQP